MEQLHPRAIWLFFVRFFFVFLFFAVFLSFFAGGFLAVILNAVRGVETGIPAASVAMIIGRSLFLWFIFFLIIVYAWSRLSYHFYRFELTPEAFRKESGVIIKKYVSIPYARIQNVDIHRGIIARLLGLSDLMIQTAGSSAITYRYGVMGIGAEGLLPGLSIQRAEELRDALIKKVGKSSGV